MDPGRHNATPERAWPVLVLFLVACFGTSALAGLWTAGETSLENGWYANLNRPSWNPPGWLFGPVWSLLYTLMAISGWLAWRHSSGQTRLRAMRLFFIQLLLNMAWSGLFFGLRRPDIAAVEILVLLATIIATIAVFRPLNKTAAWLLVPYAAWVSFASALNITIWSLNA